MSSSADPLNRLEAMLAAELQRAASRRGELAAAGDALMMLRSRLRQDESTAALGVEMLPQDIAAPIIDRLSAAVSHVDNVVLDIEVGAGVEPEHASHELEHARTGQRQRSLYADRLLTQPEHRARVDALRAAGQQQRVLDRIEHEFAIFGGEAVVTPGLWRDPASDYLVIRNPVLVGAFQGWFDLVWSLSPVRAHEGDALDDRLVQLLALGYKDEAIARHLGVALRTVRRRVAGLMDAHAVDTRFQLGAALARAGRLH